MIKRREVIKNSVLAVGGLLSGMAAGRLSSPPGPAELQETNEGLKRINQDLQNDNKRIRAVNKDLSAENKWLTAANTALENTCREAYSYIPDRIAIVNPQKVSEAKLEALGLFEKNGQDGKNVDKEELRKVFGLDSPEDVEIIDIPKQGIEDCIDRLSKYHPPENRHRDPPILQDPLLKQA